MLTILWSAVGSLIGVVLGHWFLARWALRRGLVEPEPEEYKYVCSTCQCGISATAQEPVLAFMAVHDRCQG